MEWSLLDTESTTKILQHCIQFASASAVPKVSCKIKKAKKPTKPWYPELTTAVKESRQKYHAWVSQGRPRDAPSFSVMKAAKKNIRTIQRHHHAKARQRMLDEVSSASFRNSKLFHKLVKRQRGRDPTASCVYSGETLLTNPDHIRDAWSELQFFKFSWGRPPRPPPCGCAPAEGFALRMVPPVFDKPGSAPVLDFA